MDLATLGIKVDSTQVKQSEKTLDDLGKSARKTETATDKMGKGFKQSARETVTATDKMEAGFKRAHSGAKLLVGALAAIGVTAGLRAVLANTIKQEQAERQLQSTLKATGGIAGRNAEQLTGLASSLQEVTNYGDEATIEMEALLLTFKNIRGVNFDRTTEDVLDLATAMKMDLKSAALLVGKALNDPVLGLTAMSRSGITFSDSQKTLIKSMVAVGDMAGAQVLILEELESQFGGSARAARDTLGGALASLGNAFGDLLEAKGGLTEAKDGIEELTSLLSDPEIVAGADRFLTVLINGFSGAAKSMATFGNSFALMAAYGEGKISLLEWLSAGPEDAKKILFDLSKQGALGQAIAKGKNDLLKLESELAMGGTNPKRTKELKDEIDYIKASLAEFEALIKTKKELEQAAQSTAPTSTSSGTETEQTGEFSDAVQKLVDNLTFQQQQLSRTAEQQEIYNALHSAGVEISSREGQAIAKLVSDIYSEKQARDEATKATESAEKTRQDLMKQGLDLTAKMLTPQQAFDAEIERLNTLLDAGAISWDTYIKASNALNLSDKEKAAKDYADLMQSINDINFDVQGVTTFGDPLTDGISAAVESMSRLNLAYMEEKQHLAEIAALRAEILATTIAGSTQQADALAALAAQEQGLNDKTLQSQLTGYREVFGTTKNLFKEQSKERKAMHKIEQTLAAIEIGLSLKKQAVELAAIFKTSAAATAAATTEVAANEAKAISGATAAVANQGSGDPYTAFGRIAAMIALMGGVLASAGMSFGGGGGGYASSAPQGSGTVLGDNDALSESIANSSAFLEDINSDQYAELQRITSAIHSLETSITGVVSNLVRGYGDFSASDVPMQDFDNYGQIATSPNVRISEEVKNLLGDSTMGAIIGSIFDSANLGNYAADALGEWLVNGLLGETTQSVTGSGIVLSSEGSSQFTDIETRTDRIGRGDKVTRNTIISELDAETANILDKVFGSMTDTVEQLALGLGADVDAAMSYVFDIGKVDLKGLSGEEIDEALSAAFSGSLDEAVAELFGPVVMSYQQVGETVTDTALRLLVTKDVVLSTLEDMNQGISGSNAEIIQFSDSLVTLAGGISEFQQKTGKYYDAFFSDEEKNANLLKNLTASLQQMNMSLPDSRDGFRALVEGLDLTNEADRKRYVLLLNLSEAADGYFSTLEDGQAEALKSLESEIDGLIGGVSDSVKGLQSLSKSLSSTMASMNNDPLAERQSAQRTILSALNSFRTTGGVSDISSIQAALSTVTKPSAGLFASFEDYQRDFYKTTNLISQLSEATEGALSTEEQMLQQLQDDRNIDGLQHDEAMARLEAIRAAISGDVPAFASGGYHTGGLRLVGENGPELESTGPSRIYSATQTRGMLDNSELVAEIRQLRQQQESANYAIAKNTRDTAKLLDRWDVDGLPEERAV